MPRKSNYREVNADTNVIIARTTYDAMVTVMDELAFRGPAQESIVMRIAKAGGIGEVTKSIIRRRLYLKKQRDGAWNNEVDEAADMHKRRPKKKSKSRPRRAPKQEEMPFVGGAEEDA